MDRLAQDRHAYQVHTHFAFSLAFRCFARSCQYNRKAYLRADLVPGVCMEVVLSLPRDTHKRTRHVERQSQAGTETTSSIRNYENEVRVHKGYRGREYCRPC